MKTRALCVGLLLMCSVAVISAGKKVGRPNLVEVDHIIATGSAGVFNDEEIHARRRIYDLIPEEHRKRQSGLPMVLIGTTHIDYGPLVGYGQLDKNVYTLFKSKSLTVTPGGVPHGIRIISYLDDSSDINTTIALVNTLAQVDSVHMLLTGYEGTTATAFVPAAEANGLPCISHGAFELSFFPANYTYWTLNILPNINTLGLECSKALVAKQAQNFSIATAIEELENPALLLIVQDALSLGGLKWDGKYVNVSADMWEHPELLDPVIKMLVDANPDVAVFEFGQENNIIFIDRMRRKNYNPKAYFVWGTGSYPAVRLNLTWAVAGSLIEEAYEATLNASDPLWGTSVAYDNLMMDTFKIPSANADANLATALTLAVYAFNHSPDLSPASLRAALVSYNASTIVGDISFSALGVVDRQLYCFQNDFPDASGIRTVWPQDSPGYQALIYPALIPYPSDYFEQFRKENGHALRNILLGVLIPFGLLAIIGVAIACFVSRKYHTVFIPRAGTQTAHDEWGS